MPDFSSPYLRSPMVVCNLLSTPRDAVCRGVERRLQTTLRSVAHGHAHKTGGGTHDKTADRHARRVVAQATLHSPHSSPPPSHLRGTRPRSTAMHLSSTRVRHHLLAPLAGMGVTAGACGVWSSQRSQCGLYCQCTAFPLNYTKCFTLHLSITGFSL